MRGGVFHAQSAYQPSHLEDQEVPERLSPMGYSRFEPGGPARGTAHRCTVDQHWQTCMLGPPRTAGWEHAG